MRTWSVIGKYPTYDAENKVSHTEIAIASTSNGYATFSEKVVGDHLSKSERELIELALEALFKSEFSDRAMAESVQKIDEMEVVLKTAKKFMQEAEQKLADMQKAQSDVTERLELAEEERNNRFEAVEGKFQILNGSVMEMMTELYESLGGNEGEKNEYLEDNTDVDGSDNSADHKNTETE